MSHEMFSSIWLQYSLTCRLIWSLSSIHSPLFSRATYILSISSFCPHLFSRRLLDYNQQRMPFAAAQIGQGYRNEIAPRNGLLRVREFCMAEIEHFVHPENKSHPKFKNVANTVLTLFSNDAQLGSGRTQQMTIGEAVATGLVANETLGYFMARTYLFLEKVGINPSRMRFRQHLKTEMAHYASDCWDMEIHLCYGWIECVGHADRACYDLQQHSNATGVPMVASEKLTEPVLVERLVLEPNRKLIGPKFKGAQKEVLKVLEELTQEELADMQSQLSQNSSATIHGFEIDATMVDIKSEKKNVHEIKYTPSVIEPSFGIGRVIYAILEHSFDQRDNDEQRVVMKFPPCVAPMKVGIFRIVSNPQFDPVVNRLHSTFQANNIVVKVDSSSGTLGRKYARADEIGIPFSVTIDFQSLIDNTVTVRERNTMVQIRVPIDQLLSLMKQLTEETLSWDVAVTRYPIFSSSSEEEENEGETKKESASVPTSGAPLVVERTLRSAFSRPAIPII
jgi:glycyl-tRNA synthetase